MASRKRASKPRYPSVSKILSRFKESDALMWWAWKLGRDGIHLSQARKGSMNLGKVVEAQIEARVFGELAPKIPRGINRDHIAGCLMTWDRWVEEHTVEVTHKQLSLTSEVHRFTGRLDMLATVDGNPAILELKSSGGIYLDMLLQCGAYRLLLRDQPVSKIGRLPDRAVLVRIDRDDGALHPTVWHTDALERAGRMFLTLREAYDMDQELKGVLAA